MMKSRGMSLLEVLVAASLFSLCVAALFSLFDLGSRAFQSSGAGAEARNDAALVLDRLGRMVNESTPGGTSTAGAHLALISPLDDNGNLAYDSSGHPLWQHYQLFYRNTENELRQVEVPLTAPSAIAVGLETYDFGSGPKPLTNYAAGGRSVATGVSSFEPTLEPQGILSLHLVVERPQLRNRPLARCEMRTRFSFRN